MRFIFHMQQHQPIYFLFQDCGTVGFVYELDITATPQGVPMDGDLASMACHAERHHGFLLALIRSWSRSLNVRAAYSPSKRKR